MSTIFEIIDKSGRRIHLSEERWKHILQEHPNVQNIEELRDVLKNPIRIMPSVHEQNSVRYYGLFNKDKKQYLFVAVKYLNGHGFIINAYKVKKIT